LSLNKNADISIFLRKEEKNISSQISIEFSLKYRKANIFINISKLHGEWYQKNKNIFGVVLITKSLQQRLKRF